MRRAAIQAFRSVRRPDPRRLLTRSFASSLIHHAPTPRFLGTHRKRDVLNSSMHLKTFAVALVSAAIASGAYYSSRGTGTEYTSTPGAADQHRHRSTSAESAKQAAEATRRALVVGPGTLYTGTIAGEGPISKDTDDSGRKVLEMLTPEQVTQKLRRNEESWLIGRGKGVVRYDVVQIPSNDPIEDDHAEKIIEVPNTVSETSGDSPNSDWMFWGVFDGHSGWITSAKLRQVLISFVARELNTTYKSAIADPALKFPSPESIDMAIKQGFLRLDHEIVHESVAQVNKSQSKRVAAELLAPALSGSCALLSFYDSQSKLLRVACTGDSRAVLGRRGNNGKWIATPLSDDQTGQNPSEVKRMRKEHPGEPDAIRNGRVLGGLEPTRAFGDAIYKWSIATQETIKKSYFGRSRSQLLRTPPYVTAEPVVTTTKIEPEKGDFVVMATDGLWEMLTNEEVVGLVGQWLETQAIGKDSPSSRTDSWLKSWFSSQQKGLPVEPQTEAKAGQRAPIRQQQWGVTAGPDDRFVVSDKNAATHLVRNALGGKDQDQLCALLTLPSPYSRRYRDDLTVEVIFFGEGDKSGDVTLNTAASSSTESKAKL